MFPAPLSAYYHNVMCQPTVAAPTNFDPIELSRFTSNIERMKDEEITDTSLARAMFTPDHLFTQRPGDFA